MVKIQAASGHVKGGNEGEIASPATDWIPREGSFRVWPCQGGLNATGLLYDPLTVRKKFGIPTPLVLELPLAARDPFLD